MLNALLDQIQYDPALVNWKESKKHYCLTDLSVDSVDITALVSGEQKHYFHLWGLQKPLVAFATRDFFRPHS
jgi:hypothetical protein